MTQFIDKTRRSFMGLGLAALACGMSSPSLARWTSPSAVLLSSKGGSRALSFHNLHTGERLRAVYWKDGRYDRDAWGKINHVLRDHYSGDVHVMDLRLMDLLHDLQSNLRSDRTIEVISGYRSPATNQMLAKASGGVAKHSYHMRGMAIDVRIDGTTLPYLHQTALGMRRGGVGYYPKSDFVHVDVGPVRRWGYA